MKTKTTLKERETFTVTLSAGKKSSEGSGESKREIKSYSILWAVTDMENDIQNNWYDKSVRVVAVREGSMFTPEEEEELKREKDLSRIHR